MSRALKMSVAVAAALLVGLGSSAFAQGEDEPLVSPELTRGGDVILRLRAPAAESVRVMSGGDSDDSWSTIGRAGFILDNLIAEEKAEPMIVVMPDGHTPSATRELNASQFANEFVTDIKPYVEAIYRVRAGPRSTALAGLSMGGGHTLEILASDMPSYGYAGVFSSGVFGINEGSDWVEQHMAILSDAELREDLEYFWFAVGTEDFVYDTTLATVAMLREHGFDVDYHESGGGHTWENWRVYLHDFAQAIFH
jgi:enterochelin esterase family protein